MARDNPRPRGSTDPRSHAAGEGVQAEPLRLQKLGAQAVEGSTWEGGFAGSKRGILDVVRFWGTVERVLRRFREDL